MLKLMRAPAKYVQGKDALLNFCAETEYLGKSFLFVCGRSAHKATHDKIEKSFGQSNAKRVYEIFGGISSNVEVERMRGLIREHGIDCVVGVGGGSAIDTAKAAAHYEKLPVVIVPTVCATDAPCTGLSVIYNRDGSFDTYIFYPKNPDAVIVDSAVLAASPVQFLVAGMGDALGTFIEARHCFKAKAPSLENGGITLSGMALCEACYKVLLANGRNAKLACEQGLLTPAVEAIIEVNIYLSGVGADNGGLAVAHSVYNGVTALPECEKAMHGSVVAFGSIVQLVIENAPQSELDEVIGFCRSVGLPVTLAEIGITDPARVRIAAEKACAPGESIHNMIGDVTPEELTDAMIAADILGRACAAR